MDASAIVLLKIVISLFAQVFKHALPARTIFFKIVSLVFLHFISTDGLSLFTLSSTSVVDSSHGEEMELSVKKGLHAYLSLKEVS